MSNLRIVIVDYRTPGLVLDCLRSLAPQLATERDWRVMLVDNCSGDGSASQFEAARQGHEWERWLTLLPLTENRGFAAGNNAALRVLLADSDPADYFLLLNPDTVVRPNALRALVDFMDSHPRAGLAGSRLEDPDGTPQRSAFRFPSLLSEWEAGLRLGLMSRLLKRWIVAPPVQEEAHRTDWISGASMIVRRPVLEAVGLMDDSYFLYYEETDFCYQVHRAGWECWYVPESRVVHLVGQSTGVTTARPARKRIPRYWLESRYRYFRKNHGRPYAFAASAAWALAYATWRVRRKIQGKPDPDPPQFLWDFVRFHLSPS